MELSDRMKRYEQSARPKLMRKVPIVIRLDGKAFKTYTKGLQRPFDSDFRNAMSLTTQFLVRNIQGSILGYTQSDEISILLSDTESINTDAWYDNDLTKLVSVSASLATGYFNQVYKHPTIDMLGLFDSRAFNLPEAEIENYFIWRQQDGIRNSIQTVGHYHYSAKELLNKRTFDIKQMLIDDGHMNWDQYENRFKYGTLIQRVPHMREDCVIAPLPAFAQRKNFINDLVILYGSDIKDTTPPFPENITYV